VHEKQGKRLKTRALWSVLPGEPSRRDDEGCDYRRIILAAGFLPGQWTQGDSRTILWEALDSQLSKR